MKYFVFANIILLSALTVLYWLPKGRELNAAFQTLRLQERRMAIIEEAYLNVNENLAEIEALALGEQSVKLLPYSGIVGRLTDIQALSQRLGLTETDFFLQEPVLYDTGAGTVAVVGGGVTYGGEYGPLCDMADGWLNSGCRTESLAIYKNEGKLTIKFFICGLYE
jgi:hypothetical protein